MDRRQAVVQRAQELFGKRLGETAGRVRHDREELRGWEEPAHLKGAADPASGMELAPESTVPAAAEAGHRREALGELLGVGANALEKLAGGREGELTGEELAGLEALLPLYARPAIPIAENRLGAVPPGWPVLEGQRQAIETTQRGVGRIEMMGHPEYDWAGTGFLVNEQCLLTTRRTAEIFAEANGTEWQFRPGITTWMEYRSEGRRVASAGYRVRSVIGVHDRYDLAVLEVEPPEAVADAPAPLVVASEPPSNWDGRPVYLVGYPVRDGRRGEPEVLSAALADACGGKRIQPGFLRGGLEFRDVQLVRHDCGLLGNSAGACLLDLETHQVLGVHLAGKYLQDGTAIPLWALRDDPLLAGAGVTFVEVESPAVAAVTGQVKRLARSRYWPEVQAAIAELHRRAYGRG